MKKSDITVILSILILIAVSFLIKSSMNKGEAAYVVINLAGEEYGRYDLHKDATIELDKNTVVIESEKVYMKDSNCPDHLCESQGAISKSGESIVCLPNKVSVLIEGESDPISKTDFKLGTIVSVKIYDSSDEKILDGCMEICDKYEAVCSRTSQSSELYKLNHRLISANADGSYTVSDELYEMLEEGLSYSKMSDGAFDISIGSLTTLWNFTDSCDNTVPSSADIDKALASVSYKNIRLDSDNRVFIDDPDTMIDMGGFAKGYIGDRICDYLKEQGINRAIIALGGDNICLGSDYTIGIQKPFAPQGELADKVSVTDAAIVTSGIYERYFEEDGRMYHHILDPHTGYPYDNDLVSVSVLGKTGSESDFLATYLFSMGYEQAKKYAADNSIEVILIDDSNNIFKNIK